MQVKNILIGNGINIAFSNNDDYKNYKIIERLSKYLCTNRYDDVFQGSITSGELQTVLTELNNFFKTMLKGVAALRLTQDEDELKTLIDIARRYQGKPQDILNVGIEDYFFVMKLVFNKVGDEATPINALYDGLKWLFLDAIFNDGEIEKLYTRMGTFAKELERYNKIFTVNYDTNLDRLTDKTVYHLHGRFDVLDDTYRIDTIIGYLAQMKPNPPTVVSGMEHLYCNAIMGFSGQQKMNTMSIYSNGNMALDNLILRLKNPLDIEAQQKYEQLKTSTSENDIYAFQSINARLEHPGLRNSEYPIDKFNLASGELHIIGMSPNNDSHIFRLINENPNISRVVYFSASDDDSFAAQKVIKKPIQLRNVFKYWESLNI
jgi:ribosomal protein S6